MTLPLFNKFADPEIVVRVEETFDGRRHAVAYYGSYLDSNDRYVPMETIVSVPDDVPADASLDPWLTQARNNAAALRDAMAVRDAIARLNEEHYRWTSRYVLSPPDTVAAMAALVRAAVRDATALTSRRLTRDDQQRAIDHLSRLAGDAAPS